MNSIENNEFYDVNVLLNEFKESNFKVSFWVIIHYLENNYINLTEDEIKSFLSKKSEEDNKDYEFYKNDFNYFKKYVEILRKKTKDLCKIVEILYFEELEEVKQVIQKGLPNLKEDAISIQNGLIEKDSIERLVKVITNNYIKIKEFISKANNLETYLVSNIDFARIIFNESGNIKDSLYPTEDLQVFSILPEEQDDTCLDLSTKQKSVLESLDSQHKGMVLNILLQQSIAF